MATHSKLGDLYDVSKEGILALCWSRVALYCDGLFWKAVLALARLFKLLGALIDEFYATSRTPPPFQEAPPPLEALPNMEIVKPAEADGRDRFPVGSSWASPKPELENRPVHRPREEHNWASRLPEIQKPLFENRPVPTSSRYAADIGQQAHNSLYRASAPLDPNVQVVIPHFQCDVYCHRKWRKFYAIVIGRQAGIYDCWECARPQVDRVSGQDHKSFPTLPQAEEYFGVQRH